LKYIKRHNFGSRAPSLKEVQQWALQHLGIKLNLHHRQQCNIYLHCQFRKKNGYHSCEAKALVTFESGSWVLKLSEHEHQHQRDGGVAIQRARFSDSVCKFLDEALDDARFPKSTAQKLFQKEKVRMTPQQISNYNARRKAKKVGAGTMDTAKLLKFCEDHSDIPADENQPYVVRYVVNVEGPTPNWFVGVSTKKLLQNLKRGKCLQVCALYNLTCVFFYCLSSLCCSLMLPIRFTGSRITFLYW
jgi:hypothetical protein